LFSYQYNRHTIFLIAKYHIQGRMGWFLCPQNDHNEGKIPGKVMSRKALEIRMSSTGRIQFNGLFRGLIMAREQDHEYGLAMEKRGRSKSKYGTPSNISSFRYQTDWGCNILSE
jgi:hypothetical protein